MKNDISKLSRKALVIGSLLLAKSLFASGFSIYETSARGLALGNADSARAADASTLYTNPAAMTTLPGTQVMVGFTAIMPDMRVTTYAQPAPVSPNPAPALASDQITPLNNYTAFVPHTYITQKIGDKFAAGLAIYSPYGLKSTFPDNWPGACNNYYTDIKTVDINPNIALQLFKKGDSSLSIAAGLQVVYLDVTISKALPLFSVSTPPFPAGTTLAQARNLVLEGDNIGYGWNLALQWEINKQLAIGLTYRSEIKQNLSYSDASAQLPLAFPMNPGQTVPAKGSITLPQSASLGITYTPTEKWLFAAQALWTGWSSFDALNITLKTTPAPYTSPSEKDWSDVWRFSLGMEYNYNEFITLRAGFVWDMDPVPAAHADFLVPSNDRRIYSLGVGLNFTKQFRVDFAYAVIFIDSRTITARPADNIFYDAKIDKGHANIVSLSASYKF